MNPDDAPVWGRVAPGEAEADGLGDFVATVASTEVDGRDDAEDEEHALGEGTLALEDRLGDVLPEGDEDEEHSLEGDTLALEVSVGKTLVEDDGDEEHPLDGDMLALEDPLGDVLPEGDEDGEHPLDGDTLGLEERVGDTLTEDDGEVVTLGLVEEHTAVWTVCRNGGTPPDVIVPVTV
jgi:hypothetical protein